MLLHRLKLKGARQGKLTDESEPLQAPVGPWELNDHRASTPSTPVLVCTRASFLDLFVLCGGCGGRCRLSYAWIVYLRTDSGQKAPVHLSRQAGTGADCFVCAHPSAQAF